MIKEWIEEYNPKNEEEILSALREIMQEITLAGLSRTNFFRKSSFLSRNRSQNFLWTGQIFRGSRFLFTSTGPQFFHRTLL